MVTIPVGPAARDAWFALPEEVRTEARRLADADLGHPDPAVAAIVVGWLRYEEPWPWLRNAVLIAGMSLFFGGVAALVTVGGSIHESGGVPGFVLWSVPCFGGAALVYAAGRWPARKGVSARAEVPNILAFLSAPDAAPTPPAPPVRVRPRYLTLLAMVLGTAVTGAAVTVLSGLPLRPADGVNRMLFNMLGLTVLVGGYWLYQRFRPGQPRKARRASLRPDGVSFDGRPPVPWSDIVDIGLRGPTKDEPEATAAVVFTLTGERTVETPLDGTGERPENLILAAAAHVA